MSGCSSPHSSEPATCTISSTTPSSFTNRRPSSTSIACSQKPSTANGFSIPPSWAFWWCIITLVLAVPAGYALARLTGKWGEKLGIGIFLTYLVPPTLLFIPLSRVVVNLHLDDSLWSLVLVYPSFTVPFSAWLMMGFFKAIPKDMEEAAMVDGYSRLGAFFRVVVPISLAGILTVAIFSFTLVMQEFVYAVTFISSVRNMTVSVGVPTFLTHGDVYFWGSLMAGCFIASVPVAILYNFFVDRFIAGFTMGAIK